MSENGTDMYIKFSAFLIDQITPLWGAVVTLLGFEYIFSLNLFIFIVHAFCWSWSFEDINTFIHIVSSHNLRMFTMCYHWNKQILLHLIFHYSEYNPWNTLHACIPPQGSGITLSTWVLWNCHIRGTLMHFRRPMGQDQSEGLPRVSTSRRVRCPMAGVLLD